MHLALRLFALAVIAVVAFVANAYAQQFWAGLLFPMVFPRPYTEMVSVAVVGAVSAAAVSAFPLAKLFAKHAWVAGVFVALPVIALRASDVVASGTPMQEAVAVMAWVEMLSYTVAVIVGAWFVSHRTERAGNAL